MNPFEITGEILDQHLTIAQNFLVTATNQYITAAFTFSPEWDDCSIWAHFDRGDQHWLINLDENNEITADKRLNLTTGVWEICFHGTRADGYRITTEPQEIQVRRTNVDDPVFPDVPCGDLEQVDIKAQAALDKATQNEIDIGGLRVDVDQNAADITTQGEQIAENKQILATKADKSEIPTLVSQLENDAGYITAAAIPEVPVQSVNGKTGAVVLGAADVGAQPAGDYALKSEIPTKNSQLENDAGYVTAAEIPDVPKEVITAVITNEVGRLVCDMTAREIIDASRKGVVKAEYTDEETGETREYYYFKQLPDGRACFTKDGYIEAGTPKQTLFYVDFRGDVTVETRTPDAVTVYAVCSDEAAPAKDQPNAWYVPKTQPRPSANVGLMIDVLWKNGREDGLGYDASLIWGSPDGSDNVVIVDKANVTDSLTGTHSIPTEGTVRYQLEETNGRKHWRYVSGPLASRQFSTDTAADVANKDVPGMALSYLPGMEIYIRLDRGNTAEVMNLVPAEGKTLPVYGNGTGAKTGKVKPGTILHLKNAGNYWQIVNSGGDSIDDTQTSPDTTWSSDHIVETLCPPFSKTGPVVVCNPIVGYPLSVKSHLIPQQSGSGDPSPENVRPFVPYEQAELTRCGKNLAYDYISGYISSNEVIIDGGSFSFIAPVKSGETLKFSGKEPERFIVGASVDRPQNLTKVKIVDYTENYIFTIPEGYNWITVYLSPKKEDPEIMRRTYQLEYGSVATAHTDPVPPAFYTVPLPAETYGGEVDWLGEKIKPYKLYNLADLAWTEAGTITPGDLRFWAQETAGIINPAARDSAKGDIASNVFKTTSADGTYLKEENSICLDTKGRILVYPTSAVNSVEDFMAYLRANNAQAVALLLTDNPITPSSTPKAIPGVNTLYSVGGDTTVEGREDPIATIDALTKRVADLENNAVPTV